MESKVKDGNYYVVQSFMVKELKLKGNELVVYAIIYGFSQNDGSYNGSLQYLSDWTNCTKQGVMKILKSLLDKGLINKKETLKNNVKFCEYQSLPVVNKVYPLIKQSLPDGSKQSLPNNIYNNKKDYNIDYNNIIAHLNEKAGTSYRATTPKTQSLIRARFNDGFNENDFYKVIDNMCIAWGKDAKMLQYLRPETLFGTKFESYLNYKIKTNTGGGDYANLR